LLADVERGIRITRIPGFIDRAVDRPGPRVGRFGARRRLDRRHGRGHRTDDLVVDLNDGGRVLSIAPGDGQQGAADKKD
jgi:hypothetical protein